MMYKKFEAILKEKGLKRSEVSKATGITPQAFTNWKNRGGMLNAENMQKLSEYLNVYFSAFQDQPFEEQANKICSYVSKEQPRLSDQEDPAREEAEQVAKAYAQAPESIKDAICKLLDIKRALESSKEKEA